MQFMKLQHIRLAMIFAALFAGGSQAAPGREPTVAPYGSWKSPITTQMLVQGAVRFGDMSLDGDVLYWAEGRPEEQGRYAVVRRTPDGRIEDVLPAPYSARTLANEYGGGALSASRGTVYFSNYADQRLWKIKPGEAQPQPITAQSKRRFANFVHDERRDRLIAVCEDHSTTDDEPPNRIVAVDLRTGDISVLVEGADFYSNPRISPDGRQLAWLAWNHPNMPWDDTELYVASFDEGGGLSPARKVAGELEESIFQPEWSPDGTLYFVSDRTDWWNLYAERDGTVTPILPMQAEFGAPQWVFGTTTYGFGADGQIIARYSSGGTWRLMRIDSRTGDHQMFDLPYSHISDVHIAGRRAYLTAGAPSDVETLVELDLTTLERTVLRRSSPLQPDPGFTSAPKAIEFPTDDGRTSHAFYYPPVNRDFRGPQGDAPPLVVMIHGGPTSASPAMFRLTTQYWTTRGFAVCDVNYGGSTGYGREYRNRLRDSWGVVDVADATNAALFLAKTGRADGKKLLIRGGSAGGYTTLACLAFNDVFRCGASLYGVSDLALLVHDTHKFESRYLDRLVGPYPKEERRYRERSPIYHLDGFDRPVILLQGLEDKIVPPNQAELILDSLKKRGVSVAYVPFEGEQHGFRKAENIMRAYEAELYFYSRILGFTPADEIEPVEIFNL
jgi:dipeptidyl aminopeptidase/acylaminoacyl peptidase